MGSKWEVQSYDTTDPIDCLAKALSHPSEMNISANLGPAGKVSINVAPYMATLVLFSLFWIIDD